MASKGTKATSASLHMTRQAAAGSMYTLNSAKGVTFPRRPSRGSKAPPISITLPTRPPKDGWDSSSAASVAGPSTRMSSSSVPCSRSRTILPRPGAAAAGVMRLASPCGPCTSAASRMGAPGGGSDPANSGVCQPNADER